MSFPPTLPEDTQPTVPILDDTQPIRFQGKRGWPGWFWLLLIAGTLLSLTIIVSSLLPDDREEAVSIFIQLDSAVHQVTTDADTVADVLAQEKITLNSGDLLSPEADTALEADMVIQIMRSRAVAITIDGRTTILHTTLMSPQHILQRAGVVVMDTMRVYLNGEEILPGQLPEITAFVRDITLISATPVTIRDGEGIIELRSTGRTVGDALHEAGIDVFVGDSVTPSLETTLQAEMLIQIARSAPVTIIADGVRTETRTLGSTVSDALVEAGIGLVGLDYAVPSEQIAIVPGMVIRVIRVTEELITETETLPYETIYQPDETMELDTRQVIQGGQAGIIEHSTRVRYENGAEISRIVEQENTVQAIQNEIVAYGTQVVIRTLNTPQGPVEYWRRLRVYTTSYKPEAVGGSTTTAVGETLRKGIIGINPRIIPYYTHLYVEGYGRGIAADTGGPRDNPYWIDLGYEDHDFVLWYGWEDVYLLTPVPDNINYLLPITSEGGPR